MNERPVQRLAQAQWAVRAWDEFPLHQTPRPLVLAGADVIVENGFRCGEAQDALGVGLIDWQVEVPSGVRETLQRDATLKLVEPPSRPIEITRAGQEEFSFRTDRGPRTLAAWWIQGPATLGPIWILDPTIDRWQPAAGAGGDPPPAPTQIHPLWSSIEIDADGRCISFKWLHEAPPGETIVRVEEVETETAVSLAVITQPTPAEPGVGYALMGVFHHITAWLREPLGARVFVGLHGEAIEVIPALAH